MNKPMDVSRCCLTDRHGNCEDLRCACWCHVEDARGRAAALSHEVALNELQEAARFVKEACAVEGAEEKP